MISGWHQTLTHRDKLLNICVISIKLFGILMLLLLAKQLMPADFSEAQYQWRWPLAVDIIVGILLLGTLIALNRPKRRSRVTLWLSLAITLVIAYVVLQMLMTSSTSFTAYSYWALLQNLGNNLTGIIFLFFVMAYIGQEERLYSPLLLAVLTAPTILLFGMQASTPYSRADYTYTNTLGFKAINIDLDSPSLILFLVWIYFFVLAATILLIRFIVKTKQRDKRNQAILVLLGIASPLILGFMLTRIPLLYPYVAIVTVLIAGIEPLIIAYAILHYGSFTINPATLSDVILSTMNEGVLTLNPKFEIQRANTVVANFLQINNATETEGRTLREIFGEAMSQKIIQKLDRGVEGSLEMDLEIKQKTLPISIVSSTIRNSDNSIAGYVLVFRDITKEHAAKTEIERQVVERTEQVHEEQIKLKASIESLNLGLVMIDKDNQVVLNNAAVSGILGGSGESWTLPG
jgi:PAS domain-containing protein